MTPADTPFPYTTLFRSTGLRTVFDRACTAQNLQPSIALQASAADAIADLAARGLGIAVLSTSMAASYGDRLTARTIEDIETPALLALVWKRSEEHTSELQSLMRISYAVFCLKKKK